MFSKIWKVLHKNESQMPEKSLNVKNTQTGRIKLPVGMVTEPVEARLLSLSKHGY